MLEHEINVVFNLFKYALNSVEWSALNHGLQYSILPPYFDFLQTQTSFEKLYQESRPYLNHQDKIELKRIFFNLYSKYKSGFFFSKKQKFSNISKEELEALKTLSADQNLIISKPDKGNGVVILDKLDYISKMKLSFCDRTTFQSANHNNNLQQLQKFQQFLARLKKRKAIDDEVYQRIRPISASTPTLYGLPKIHKNDTPLRPILSSVGSYNHECAKWLSEILTPLRHHSTTVKDIFDFLHRLHNISIDNKIMDSFDVISLFTDIPVDFTINLIL